MREHLHALHKRQAQHHSVKSAHHAAVAGHFQKLASALGKSEVSEAQKDTAGILEALSALHEKLSDEHESMSAHHQQKMEDCAKGMDAADLTKLTPLPAGLSTVTPTAPIRAIPRFGAPGPAEKIPVPEEFQKLASIED